MPATLMKKPETVDLGDDINEALYDAYCDGEGRATANYLCHHLALRGLVIVSARNYDALLTGVQLIGSYPVTSPKDNMDAANMAKIASDIIKRVEG